MPDLLPVFLTLRGRAVLLVGGGRVAAAKLQALIDTGADVRVVAPTVTDQIAAAGVAVSRRPFVPADLDGVWFVVAAATPEVNREVAAAAAERRIFVNAVDDPANASAFLSGTLRRDGVTIAISSSGEAPALTSLLREGLDAMLPPDLNRWMGTARTERTIWRDERVPFPDRKPKLLAAINALYDKKELRACQPRGSGTTPGVPGRVWLVGAGPGDPSLLTRKAIACLRAADVVLYDALIDDRVLRYARKAQRFFAGKRGARAGGPGSRRFEAMTQQTINTVMIRAARRGRRVVRLKGGDPFVFGRGGEEAQALRDAGIPVEVVPGVTSAFAAASLAGIPLTHRGVSSAIVVVAGHDAAVFRSRVASVRPAGVTLIVLMGGGRTAAVAAVLDSLGWPSQTPAAVVTSASTAGQQVWKGTLGQLPEIEVPQAAPATIILGDVVALSATTGTERERTYVTGT
jgi:uroporphyrin-III C-methyltransferase / precorrin-2 dehydrogenase / sirohydrochlorin ferrochelatase